MGALVLGLPALEMAMQFMPPQKWMRWVNLALGIVASGIDVAERLKALNAQIQTFVDEKRGPTDEEWAALVAEDQRIFLSIENAPLNPA
jgi:hypothetical protein